MKNKIATIRMCFLTDACDLNHKTFNTSLGFHVIPKSETQGGFLKRLSSEIRGSKFHSVDMTRDPSGVDLEVALSFKGYMVKQFVMH